MARRSRGGSAAPAEQKQRDADERQSRPADCPWPFIDHEAIGRPVHEAGSLANPKHPNQDQQYANDGEDVLQDGALPTSALRSAKHARAPLNSSALRVSPHPNWPANQRQAILARPALARPAPARP